MCEGFCLDHDVLTHIARYFLWSVTEILGGPIEIRFWLLKDLSHGLTLWRTKTKEFSFHYLVILVLGERAAIFHHRLLVGIIAHENFIRVIQTIILAAPLFFDVLSNDLRIKVLFKFFDHVFIDSIFNSFQMLIHFPGLFSHKVLLLYLSILFVYGLSKYPEIGGRWHLFGQLGVILVVQRAISVFVCWISWFLSVLLPLVAHASSGRFHVNIRFLTIIKILFWISSALGRPLCPQRLLRFVCRSDLDLVLLHRYNLGEILLFLGASCGLHLVVKVYYVSGALVHICTVESVLRILCIADVTAIGVLPLIFLRQPNRVWTLKLLFNEFLVYLFLCKLASCMRFYHVRCKKSWHRRLFIVLGLRRIRTN